MHPVTCDIEGGIATIVMNDGKANVMHASMLNALLDSLKRAGEARAAVVLRSALPNTFSAGFDLKVFAARDAKATWAMMRAGGELLHAMLTYPRPIIAVADGQVFPMGLFTLLAADYRVGSEAAAWRLNEAEIGIVPPRYAIAMLDYRLGTSWLSRALLTAAVQSAADGLHAAAAACTLPRTKEPSP